MQKSKKKPDTQYTKVSRHNSMANRYGFGGIISALLAVIIGAFFASGGILSLLMVFLFIGISLTSTFVNLLINIDVVKEGYLFYTWEKDADRSVAHKWLAVYSLIMVAVGFGFMKYMVEYLFSVGFEWWYLFFVPATVLFFLLGLGNLFYTFSKWNSLEKDLEDYQKEIAALNAIPRLDDKPKNDEIMIVDGQVVQQDEERR